MDEEKYECDHIHCDDTSAIVTVWYRAKDKNGKEYTARDYEYCEICGKRFCVSD